MAAEPIAGASAARNIDLARRTVRIEASVSEVGGALVVGPPKSAAGVRTIALPEAIVPELRTHLRRYAEPGAHGRVFTGPKGATIRRSNWHTRRSRPAAATRTTTS